MTEDLFIVKNHKKLLCGFTTGTCAAAAAKAAATMLLRGTEDTSVRVTTPGGVAAEFYMEDISRTESAVSCSVRKYSGDDPDVTDGIKIFASVKKNLSGEIRIDGGEGVGRVTKKGLSCPVGSAAINPAPKAMIEREVLSVCAAYKYPEGLDVVISVPNGEEIAKRTFNARLGIEGGISILGTSGIVEPMSEQALVDTIRVEMNMMRANGAETLVFVPGNYGMDYLLEHIGIPHKKVVKCSNFIGETLDHALDLGFNGVLLVGHIGKLVKLAGGIMNTHSRYADCRMEILAAYAAASGADKDLTGKLLAAVTVDEALEMLDAAGLMEETMHRIMERIEFHVAARLQNKVTSGAIVFSNAYGVLGRTANVSRLMDALKERGGNA